jgi:hypothetical protein
VTPIGGDWRIGADETIKELLADYEQACEQSREIAARFGLDDRAPHPRLGQVFLREQIDGAVGFDG